MSWYENIIKHLIRVLRKAGVVRKYEVADADGNADDSNRQKCEAPPLDAEGCIPTW